MGVTVELTWIAGFLVVVALAYVVPGPDFVVILRHATRSASAGRIAAAGVVTGLIVHMTAAVLGLSALLAGSATAFTVVKIVGAAYLLGLGAHLLWSTRPRRTSGSDEPAPEPPPGAVEVSHRRAFAQGFLTNVLNPKAALFFLSLLPQFLDPAAPALPQTLLLGTLTVGFGVLWWLTIVTVAARVRGVLSRPTARRALDRITGLVFVALGVRLVTTPAT